MTSQIIASFQTLFHRKDGYLFFSPGRINIIGEHIDYNGGFVLPFAIDRGLYGVVGLRKDRNVNVLSKPFSNDVYQFSLDNLVKDVQHSWADYIKGSIKVLMNRGLEIPYGFDLYIDSDLPIGAGLSSSAAIELLIIYMLDYFYQFNLDVLTMAKLGQDCEKHFIGVNSGIMDQYAVIASKEGHALLLDTKSLIASYVPINFKAYTLVIANTNKKRGLIDSKYNERYHECQKALAVLKDKYPIKNLCDLKVYQLENIEKWIAPKLYKRVHHVVTENERTSKCASTLSDLTVDDFSKLMNASHASLRDAYEVTGIELDTLQRKLIDHGASCARMTGAGFGGCAIALIKNEKLEEVMIKTRIAYHNLMGYEPSFYIVHSSGGTHLMKKASE